MSLPRASLAFSSAGLAFSSLACGDEDPRFLSLARLCPELAADICEARNGGCCATGVEPVRCAMDEEASCSAASNTFTVEATLRYDAVEAAKQHERTRTTLGACGTLPVLASYFQGGLPSGAPCERSGQCASGSCASDVHLCVESVPTPLCTLPATP